MYNKAKTAQEKVDSTSPVHHHNFPPVCWAALLHWEGLRASLILVDPPSFLEGG